MPRFELSVGATEFWNRLDSDIREAKHSVYLQAMTFEGDEVGEKVAQAMRSSAAQDRKILVDSYTLFVMSDRFVYSPKYWRDEMVRGEVRSTKTLFGHLAKEGVGVRFTNPVGPLMYRFPARNHKKLMIIDGRVAYLGGINFSDHNFEWHDLMVRIEDENVATHLADDFQATWGGKPSAGVRSFDGVSVYSLDGRSNSDVFQGLLDLVGGAKKSVHVISPYLTFPFCNALRAACQRGVKVVLLTPAANNKGLVRDYLLWEAHRSGFEVRLFQGGMSHLKAMLVDEQTLVLGSSNFDFVSFHAQEELLAIFTDHEIVRSFCDRVLEVDLQNSSLGSDAVSATKGWRSFVALKVAEAATRMARRSSASRQVIEI